MKRPLCLFTLFFITGVLCGQATTSIVAVALFFISAILLLTLVYLRTKTPEVFFGVIFFVLGFFQLNNALLTKAELPAAYHNAPITLTGYMTEVSATKSGGVRATMQIISPEHFKVIAYLDEQQVYSPTQLISVTGTLQEPAYRTNPGGFNQFLYYRVRGISYTVYADEVTDKNETILNPITIMQALRGRLAAVYDRVLPEAEAGIVKAMVLGYNTALDQETATLYKQAGISHVIAISGMHLSLIAFVVYKGCMALRVSKRRSSLITIGMLALYTLFVGAPASGVRALIMASCMLSSNLVHRKADLPTSIAFSALLQLFFQPLLLWDAGFQLSYAAIIGILLFSQMANKLAFVPAIVRNVMAPTIGATLATLPIVLYHFYFVSVVGIAVNLFILPFAGLVLLVAILIGIVGLLSIPIALYFSGVVYYILRFYWVCCYFFVSFPFSILPVGQISVWLVCLFFSLLIFSYICIFIKRTVRQRIQMFLLGFFIIMPIGVTLTLLPKDFELTFLDVGQGDSIVATTPDRKGILIDGGGSRSRFEKGLSNTGEYVVYPFLQYKGITRLEAIFISHFDVDHMAGVLEIIPLMPVDCIYISPPLRSSNDTEVGFLYNSLLTLAKQYNIPIRALQKGDQLELAGLRVTCLSPFEGAFTDQNNNSLVLMLQYQDANILLTGDMEEKAEQVLLLSNETIRADILKVAHHGSKTSSTHTFVQAVAPSVAVISCAKNNMYGHPHEAVLDSLKQTIPSENIWTTGNNGAIVCTVKNDTFTIGAVLDEERSKYERVKR